MLKKLKFHFIITAKEGDLKYLFEFYRAVPGLETTESDAKATHAYRYANDLPLNDNHSDLEVNVLECTEQTKKRRHDFVG